MSTQDLRLQVILQALDQASGPLKAISGNSSKMGAVLKAARDELSNLKRAAGKVDEFQKGAQAIQANAQATEAARGKLREMQAQILAAQHPHRKLTDEYKAQRREVLNLERAGVRLNSNQAALTKQITAAGVPVSQLASRQAQLRQRMEQVNATIREQSTRMERLKNIQKRYQQTMALRDKAMSFGTGALAAGGAMGAPLVHAVREYASFEDALLGVQRQVEGVGEVGSVAYKQISAEIRQLGRELPLPINQIADMYTAAARMEVPREELREFTRTVTMMATAFDTVPDEIAEAMGKVAKNFRIPVTEIRDLADVVNYLDDNAISKADGIIDVLNRTAGTAASVKISAKQTAALASTLLTLGERTETAGTAINAIITKFAAAEKGTKKFRSAIAEIGLTTKDVQEGMQTDTQGTLFRIVEAIQKLPEGARTGVMVELVGMEHADTLAKLVTNTVEWRRQIELAESEAAKGSMEREFAKRSAAITAHWERFKNALFDVNTESGAALRDSLMGVMETVGGVLNRMADWMRANPQLTAALVKTAAVVAIIVTAMGALALALAAVLGPFAVARYGLAMFGLQAGPLAGALWSLAKGALPAVAAGLRVVLGLLIANPIGAIIAAVAGAAYLIWRNWDTLVVVARDIWAEVRAAFAGGLSGVGALLLNWSPLGAFYKAFAQVLSWFGIELPGKFSEFGGMLIAGLVRGITGALGSVKDAITGAGGAVVGWFKEKLGIRSPSRVFAALGGFTMQGLAQGLQRSAGAPLDAMNRAMRTFAVAAGTGMAGVAMAAGAGIQFDTRPPLAAGAMGAGAVSNQYEIHIHAAAGMDPEQIARAVAAELDRRDRANAARRRSRLADDE